MRTQQASVRKGYVSGEFITDTYRISGEVDLQGTPLLDRLNDHNTLFTSLERMFISPLFSPSVLTDNYNYGEVRKDMLGIVILNRLQDGLPYRRGQYMGRDHKDRNLLIVAAGLEIRGSLRLHPSVNITNFVRTTPEQFIPLFNASATLTAQRDIVFEGGAILLNRRKIEVFTDLND